MKNKTGVCRALLLVGMGLMIPCYLFTAGNTLLSPWPLYDRNRLVLCLLTPLCLLLLLLLGRAAKAKVFETHERAVLLGFAAFYFVIQLVMASALRFTPVTDLEQCVTAARRLAQTGAFGDSERSLIYFGRYPHNMGLDYLLAGIFKAADALGADELTAAALVCGLLFSMGLLCAARLCRRLGGAQAQARAAAVRNLPAVSLLHFRIVHRRVFRRIRADDRLCVSQSAGRGQPKGTRALGAAVRGLHVFRRTDPLSDDHRRDRLPDCGAL